MLHGGVSQFGLACPVWSPFVLFGAQNGDKSGQKRANGDKNGTFRHKLGNTPIYQRIAKGAGGKGPRQKTSKIVKKCQKVFRHFSTIFAQGKKRQKIVKKRQKSFSTLFDNFRAAPFFRPLLGGSEFSIHPQLALLEQVSFQSSFESDK